MTVLIGADLDRTLIYSRGAVERYGGTVDDLVVVERYRDADASWLTRRAAALLAGIPAAGGLLVPVSTRTPEQLARVRLPGVPSRYAVAANGGVLLVDGEPDPAWAAVVTRAVAQAAGLPEILAHVEATTDPTWVTALREAHGLFCYAVIDRDLLPPDYVAETTRWAADRGWQVSLQGRKLYWVPGPLTKSAALVEVTRRTEAGYVLAAGDSLLDADLLLTADEAIAARHGELVESGWQAPGVATTVAGGVLAGEEIAGWLTERVSRAAAADAVHPARTGQPTPPVPHL